MKIDFSRVMLNLANRFGDKPCMINLERGRSYSFHDYHRITNRIAHALHRGLGLGTGDVYINILENDNMSLIHLPVAFKQLATGAWTNYRDSLEEHLAQVDLAGARVAFVENALLPTHYAPLRERDITIVAMDPIEGAYPDAIAFDALLADMPETEPHLEFDDRDHDVVLRFTGGTTGKGKCARYSLDNFYACRDSFLYGGEIVFTDRTRWLHVTPLSHGTMMMYLPALFQGGTQFTQNVADLERFSANIEAHGITHSFVVPTMLYRMLETGCMHRYDLSSLDTVYYGAAPMSPTKLADLQAACGNVFMQGYGATEHLTLVTRLEKSDHEAGTPEAVKRHLASCGKPTPAVEFKVVDDDGNEVATGEVGEFWHRSKAICRGYYNNPEQTAEEFHDGWWKSGDLGYLDADGYAYIVDRKKDMIVTGGFNVYATEVEAALNTHPDVVMSAVVGIPHDEWGEAVHAEVVVKDGAKVAAATLIEQVKARIGRHKAPKSIAFVPELPLSAVGKVLRREVRDKYWAGTQRRVN